MTLRVMSIWTMRGPGRVVLALNQEGEGPMQPWVVATMLLVSIAWSGA